MRRILLSAASALALVTGAQAADLGVRRVEVPSAIMASGFSWTGFYAGVHAGYGWGRSTGTNPFGGQFPLSTSGALLGAQVGYNYQINSLVLGVEADLAYTTIGGHTALGLTGRNNMLGSLRARAGFAVDRSLFYVTGGLGIQTASFTQGAGAAEKYTRFGWVLGAGYEYAITNNWTVKAEYMYYNFGTRTLGPIYAGTLRSDGHTVKLGVNYLFSTGPSAVVARY
ncbi:porin family protein [Phreatobacter aquaticus]|uniref:Porin family protein n=1 Tax=Phreatobacter aquaticus TaxID=2570229 RepID=A0A4D7QQ71_9HYPH|nr:outer membrane protein [Phreatobacter aquaticus]QCK86262.1 porin family protein [Phreatobacter aquaticus]